MKRLKHAIRAARQPGGSADARALPIALFCTLVALSVTPSVAIAEPIGEIAGTVTDAATHQALTEINVCAYAVAGGSSCTLTDSNGDGKYLIAVAPGEYQVGFSSIEHIYLTQFWNAEEREVEGDLVSVAEGVTTNGIDAAMQEGGRISGTVTAATGGAPIKGIDACASEAGGAGSTVSCAQTDVHGEYTIPELPGGSYKVEFSPGFCFDCGSLAYRTQFYDGQESWPEANPVAVTLGATTGSIDVQMRPITHTLTVSRVGSGSGIVTSSPAGIGCGATCAAEFQSGEAVTLAATAAQGSHFGGWSGGCTGSGPCQLTLHADVSVLATFESDAGSGGEPGSGGGHQDSAPPPTQPPPPGPGPSPPDTKITRARVDSVRRTAKFAFHATGTATSFECRMRKSHHKARFTPCSSRRTYKHLRPGWYVFSVRALGPGGLDLSPATRRFKIGRVT